MPEITLQQLLMSGAHFGHLTRRWNPKMKPNIFMERSGIYIIDLNKTLANIIQACEVSSKIVGGGREDTVCGNEKVGEGHHSNRGGALRHALCERKMAGRNADEFQHDQKEHQASEES